jgi:hypothetical protein
MHLGLAQGYQDAKPQQEATCGRERDRDPRYR